MPPIVPAHEKALPERLVRDVVGRSQRPTAMFSMSNIAGIGLLEKEWTMLYDLHLIADAFLAEVEMGQQRGLEESETEGIGPSDDQSGTRGQAEFSEY